MPHWPGLSGRRGYRRALLCARAHRQQRTGTLLNAGASFSSTSPDGMRSLNGHHACCCNVASHVDGCVLQHTHSSIGTHSCEEEDGLACLGSLTNARLLAGSATSPNHAARCAPRARMRTAAHPFAHAFPRLHAHYTRHSLTPTPRWHCYRAWRITHTLRHTLHTYCLLPLPPRAPARAPHAATLSACAPALRPPAPPLPPPTHRAAPATYAPALAPACPHCCAAWHTSAPAMLLKKTSLPLTKKKVIHTFFAASPERHTPLPPPPCPPQVCLHLLVSVAATHFH